MSALDSKVANSIFDEVLLGYLSNKTKIMVTHNLQILDRVDEVILMTNGSISTQGHYSEVKNHASFILFKIGLEPSKNSAKNKTVDKDLDTFKTENLILKNKKIVKNEPEKHIETIEKKEEIRLEKKLDRVSDESTTEYRGLVGIETHRFYFRNGGRCLTILVFIMIIASLLTKLIADWWIG